MAKRTVTESGVTVDLSDLTIGTRKARDIVRIVVHSTKTGRTAHETVRAVDAYAGEIVTFSDYACVAQRASRAILTIIRPSRPKACCASDRAHLAVCVCGDGR